MTNAARHSAASIAQVDVTVHGGELTIRVTDNGIGGVDTSSPSGSGMLGMRDRVVAVGGRMTVSSPTGGGTMVAARLPCG